MWFSHKELSLFSYRQLSAQETRDYDETGVSGMSSHFLVGAKEGESSKKATQSNHKQHVSHVPLPTARAVPARNQSFSKGLL